MTKVLIVDDDAAFRRAVRSLLREQFPRKEVTEVSNGQEALQRLGGRDLLFVDISLALENDLELVAKIISTQNPRSGGIGPRPGTSKRHTGYSLVKRGCRRPTVK